MAMLKAAARDLKRLIQFLQMRRDPVGFARAIGVQVGNRCRFLGLTFKTFGSEPYLIRIGNHVTLTSGIRFITHDGGVWVFRDNYPDIDVIAPITVGNNVFIGINAIIMPGVSIGDNCVIGAGSIVTHDIPSGHVAVGAPARCIKTVDEYLEKIRSKATHIRSMPEGQKQTLLKTMFENQIAHD